jgi:hypothetical protein
VNAHKLITKANESSADVLFILDCFFPTKSILQWKREDHMTEIIIAGREMHDVNGRPIAGPENFDEGFSNAMRDILAKPRGEARQTIPRIMGRDTSLCTTPQRHWLNKPDRVHPDRRVWRFFFDIGRMKPGDIDKLQLRRCEVTGRRVGEFGGDPDLDNDGWGSDGGGGGGNDGGGDDDDDDNYDGDEARHEGGEDDDGNSSNGGWGRGFGRTRRRTPSRRESAEVKDDGKGDDNSSDSVARNWATVSRSLGLPKKLSDEEAIDLVKRLQALPKHLKRKQPSGGLPTPSSGIQKRAREKRPASAGAEGRGRSELATRPRRNSTVASDWEIISVQRVGHQLGSPINLSGETPESSTAAKEEGFIGSWLKHIVPRPFFGQSLKVEDEEVVIKRSNSPVPRAGGDSSSGASGASEWELSMDSDLEITREGPVNRPLGHIAFIDLTDGTDDLE